MSEAYVVIDTDGSAEFDGSENKINGMISKAEAQDIPVFYVLPEGTDIHPKIDVATVSSVLRYEPDDDPYDSAHLDEQITNREIDTVTFFGFGDNVSDIAERDDGRSAGRSVNVESNATF